MTLVSALPRDAEVVSAFQLCLTEGAKDECNVVEVVARDHDNQEIAVPVANLRLSCQPMVSWSRSLLGVWRD